MFRSLNLFRLLRPTRDGPPVQDNDAGSHPGSDSLITSDHEGDEQEEVESEDIDMEVDVEHEEEASMKDVSQTHLDDKDEIERPDLETIPNGSQSQYESQSQQQPHHLGHQDEDEELQDETSLRDSVMLSYMELSSSLEEDDQLTEDQKSFVVEEIIEPQFIPKNISRSAQGSKKRKLDEDEDEDDDEDEEEEEIEQVEIEQEEVEEVEEEEEEYDEDDEEDEEEEEEEHDNPNDADFVLEDFDEEGEATEESGEELRIAPLSASGQTASITVLVQSEESEEELVETQASEPESSPEPEAESAPASPSSQALVQPEAQPQPMAQALVQTSPQPQAKAKAKARTKPLSCLEQLARLQQIVKKQETSNVLVTPQTSAQATPEPLVQPEAQASAQAKVKTQTRPRPRSRTKPFSQKQQLAFTVKLASTSRTSKLPPGPASASEHQASMDEINIHYPARVRVAGIDTTPTSTPTPTPTPNAKSVSRSSTVPVTVTLELQQTPEKPKNKESDPPKKKRKYTWKHPRPSWRDEVPKFKTTSPESSPTKIPRTDPGAKSKSKSGPPSPVQAPGIVKAKSVPSPQQTTEIVADSVARTGNAPPQEEQSTDAEKLERVTPSLEEVHRIEPDAETSEPLPQPPPQVEASKVEEPQDAPQIQEPADAVDPDSQRETNVASSPEQAPQACSNPGHVESVPPPLEQPHTVDSEVEKQVDAPTTETQTSPEQPAPAPPREDRAVDVEKSTAASSSQNEAARIEEQEIQPTQEPVPPQQSTTTIEDSEVITSTQKETRETLSAPIEIGFSSSDSSSSSEAEEIELGTLFGVKNYHTATATKKEPEQEPDQEPEQEPEQNPEQELELNATTTGPATDLNSSPVKASRANEEQDSRPASSQDGTNDTAHEGHEGGTKSGVANESHGEETTPKNDEQDDAALFDLEDSYVSSPHSTADRNDPLKEDSDKEESSKAQEDVQMEDIQEEKPTDKDNEHVSDEEEPQIDYDFPADDSLEYESVRQQSESNLQKVKDMLTILEENTEEAATVEKAEDGDENEDESQEQEEESQEKESQNTEDNDDSKGPDSKDSDSDDDDSDNAGGNASHSPHMDDPSHGDDHADGDDDFEDGSEDDFCVPPSSPIIPECAINYGSGSVDNDAVTGGEPSQKRPLEEEFFLDAEGTIKRRRLDSQPATGETVEASGASSNHQVADNEVSSLDEDDIFEENDVLEPIPHPPDTRDRDLDNNVNSQPELPLNEQPGTTLTVEVVHFLDSDNEKEPPQPEAEQHPYQTLQPTQESMAFQMGASQPEIQSSNASGSQAPEKSAAKKAIAEGRLQTSSNTARLLNSSDDEVSDEAEPEEELITEAEPGQQQNESDGSQPIGVEAARLTQYENDTEQKSTQVAEADTKSNTESHEVVPNDIARQEATDERLNVPNTCDQNMNVEAEPPCEPTAANQATDSEVSPVKDLADGSSERQQPTDTALVCIEKKTGHGETEVYSGGSLNMTTALATIRKAMAYSQDLVKSDTEELSTKTVPEIEELQKMLRTEKALRVSADGWLMLMQSEVERLKKELDSRDKDTLDLQIVESKLATARDQLEIKHDSTLAELESVKTSNDSLSLAYQELHAWAKWASATLCEKDRLLEQEEKQRQEAADRLGEEESKRQEAENKLQEEESKCQEAENKLQEEEKKYSNLRVYYHHLFQAAELEKLARQEIAKLKDDVEKELEKERAKVASKDAELVRTAQAMDELKKDRKEVESSQEQTIANLKAQVALFILEREQEKPTEDVARESEIQDTAAPMDADQPGQPQLFVTLRLPKHTQDTSSPTATTDHLDATPLSNSGGNLNDIVEDSDVVTQQIVLESYQMLLGGKSKSKACFVEFDNIPLAALAREFSTSTPLNSQEGALVVGPTSKEMEEEKEEEAPVRKTQPLLFKRFKNLKNVELVQEAAQRLDHLDLDATTSTGQRETSTAAPSPKSKPIQPTTILGGNDGGPSGSVIDKPISNRLVVSSKNKAKQAKARKKGRAERKQQSIKV
ncbi:hypothetical protein Cantr_07219 [Candida viswanathii]|uniref:Uncharacterized protein n=1 Tax=Candida viswanathii TaxID=5486 RepID=A0A367XZG2_9ASCO|nr:hypothetical protein Cantr_07219 [Candida viswanathii]